MACSRCGGSRPARPVPPPSVSRPGTQVPRPAQGQRPSSISPSDAVRDAINGMRLPYVPPAAR